MIECIERKFLEVDLERLNWIHVVQGSPFI